MNKNKLFIFEFIAGGGFNQEEIPPSLFCEGYGMLRSIISDFKELNFEISTLVDYRITFLSSLLKADSIITVSSNDNYLEKFKKMVFECNYCFIIAPEFSNILYDLTKIVIEYNKTLLSIELDGVELFSSKIKTYEFFKKNGMKTPLTYEIPLLDGTLDINFVLEKFGELKGPIIIKPEDGVGAEHTYYFRTKFQLKRFFKKIDKRIEPNRRFIIQEYIQGWDLSLSLIGTKTNTNLQNEKPLLLSINYQAILRDRDGGIVYFGGATPNTVGNNEDIIKNIEIELKKLNILNLNGYFGVDFIMKGGSYIYFIEINPRLTTSYIGIRNATNINPAQLILDSKLGKLKPIQIELESHSDFAKWDLIYKGKQTVDQIYNNIIPNLLKEIPEIITPPLSFEEQKFEKNTIYSCLVATKEEDYNSSINRLTKMEKILKKYGFIII
jgi:predicted ATP-grasp superfamily ATP-dependent carboligase